MGPYMGAYLKVEKLVPPNLRKDHVNDRHESQKCQAQREDLQAGCWEGHVC